MSMGNRGLGSELEVVPANEAAQIDHIAELTVKQLDRRYAAAPKVLRGVHPKDHGCVEATFTVAPDLPPALQVGVFASPGKAYRAAIRFSNAAPLVTPDSPVEAKPGGGGSGPAHGSRGMAIKLYGVTGNRLDPDDREHSQDFLMINQPVFAFANVEDYEALSQLIAVDDRLAPKFFERLGAPDPAVRARAGKSLGIIQNIKSLLFPPAFQAPPLSPLDNRYFSAAPFMFGPGRVMKFSANPVNPMSGDLGDAINDPDYLRNALRKRMAAAQGKEICFDFQVQLRTADSLAGKLQTDIEDMCTLWDEATYPYVTVARITIAQQDVASPERQDFCERLVYTPWHGLEEHRPLGGINRMRRKVYEASSQRRGCPFSPELPALNTPPDPRARPTPGLRGTPSPSGGLR